MFTARHSWEWFRSHAASGAAIGCEGDRMADQVTVYALLRVKNERDCARFFVTRNSNVESGLRQPPDWRDFALIDVDVVEPFENNWDLLKS